MKQHWALDSVFYHIYPLGLCGAPARNDFASAPQPRLEQLHGWMGHLQSLGVNAVYLGPLFESTAHGYDTADYYHVDRRLGSDETLCRLVAEFHARGIRLVLDGVFNHVGRDFWAFRDVLAHGAQSSYSGWFKGLRFGGTSPYRDPFIYEGWNGNYDLVKLDLQNPAVKEYLFGAVESWIHTFGIDGLRLDAADSVDLGFQRELAAFCRRLRPDFWLMGEIVHGDYRKWANPDTLDSTTNYECYKALYSSHVDKNFFEIAYALNRQSGEHGLYRDLMLYTFADNHDVDRVASRLADPAHLYTLYSLLFTMPGVPSIYYGSEWGLRGKKSYGNDYPLRPALDVHEAERQAPEPRLAKVISQLVRIRRGSEALRHGDYQQLHVSAEQLAFARQSAIECMLVAINASDKPARLQLDVPVRSAHTLVDVLNGGERFRVEAGKVTLESVPPHWARILRAE